MFNCFTICMIYQYFCLYSYLGIGVENVSIQNNIFFRVRYGQGLFLTGFVTFTFEIHHTCAVEVCHLPKMSHTIKKG